MSTVDRVVPGMTAMQPFLPAKDFAASLRFYTDLGFRPVLLDDGLASMHLESFAFLLQDLYVKDWAENFMMHVSVRDLSAWWDRIDGLDLASRYGVKEPTAPALQSWGLLVSYVWDPCGVLWHFAQEPGGGEPISGG